MVANNRFFSVILGLVLASLVRGGDFCSGTQEIKSSKDFDKYKSCIDFPGKVTIYKGFTGPVLLPGLERITGELVIESPQVTEIVFEKLVKVNKLTIKEANLKQLNFKFKEADSLIIDGLKGDFPLHFTSGLVSAKSVEITNNFITSLEGLNFEKVGSLKILSNTKLNSISLPNLVESEGTLQFKGNEQATLSAPKLTKVGEELDVSKVKSIQLAKLKESGKSLLLSELNGESYEFPELTKAYGIKVSNNGNLKSIKFPVLKEITTAGFSLENNNKLVTAEVPALVSVDGLYNVDAPALTEFKFNDNLASDGHGEVKIKLPCSKFDNVKKQFKGLNCTEPKPETIVEKDKEKVSQDPSPITPTPTKEGDKTGSALTAAIPSLSALLLGLLATLY